MLDVAMVASDVPLRPRVQTQCHGWGIEGGPADVDDVGICWSMLVNVVHNLQTWRSVMSMSR